MRQAVIALLAVPVAAAARIGRLARRSTILRSGLLLVLAVVLGLGAAGAGRPSTAIATGPRAIEPLTQAAFTTTFSTNRGLAEPVTIRFTSAMDPASVATAVSVDPPTAVELAWDATGTVLTVTPRGLWTPGTFHTVTVEAGALASSGQPLARPIRAAFLTRDATTASVVATEPVGERVAVRTAFVVSFARPVTAASVEGAIRLDPPVAGKVEATETADGVTRYSFVPSEPLRPDVQYRLTVSGVRDTDGIALETLVLPVTTVKAPVVVGVLPRAGTQDVAGDAPISVRFSEPMDRRSTARAFSARIGTVALAGTVAWTEHDTVLRFTPGAALPYGATVSVDVAAGAESATGTELATPGHEAFTVVATPAPARAPDAATLARPLAPAPTAKKPTGSGGGAVGGGSWAAVETYYLGLMNCTRTGGWVTSSGHCTSPGGRDVAPLKLDAGISSKVTRPYARKLAVGADCSHFIGGNPGNRLRAAGYTSYRWAENLGCRSGDAMAAVLGSHLFFQSEKSYNGGHYRNLMNAAYDRVGIGVWVSGGQVRLVIDFYHP